LLTIFGCTAANNAQGDFKAYGAPRAFHPSELAGTIHHVVTIERHGDMHTKLSSMLLDSELPELGPYHRVIVIS
jgi:hypothetical protein